MLPTKPPVNDKEPTVNYGCWISWFSILALALISNIGSRSHPTAAPSQEQTSTPAPSVIVNINTMLGESKTQVRKVLAKYKQTDKGSMDEDTTPGVTYFEEYQIGHVAKGERGTKLTVGYSKTGKVMFIMIDNQEPNGLGYQLDQSVLCLARFGISNLGEPDYKAPAGWHWYTGSGSEMRHVSTVALGTNEQTIWSVKIDRDKH